MTEFNLDSYLPDASNKKQIVQPEPAADLSTEVKPYDMQAVNRLTTDILDSALHGLEDDDISLLYLVLQDIADYKTIDAVQSSTKGIEAVSISPAMFIYLYLIDSDVRPLAACKALKISRSQAVIWNKENKLFAAVLDAIKAGQAEELEASVWHNALTNLDADKERVLALKARKPEYRENAPEPAAPAVSIRITVDNAEIDISDNYRKAIDITPENEQ